MVGPAGSTVQGVGRGAWPLGIGRGTVRGGESRRRVTAAPSGHKRHVVGSVSRPRDGNANALLGGDKGAVFAAARATHGGRGSPCQKHGTRLQRAPERGSAWRRRPAGALHRSRCVLKNCYSRFGVLLQIHFLSFENHPNMERLSSGTFCLAALLLRTSKNMLNTH